MNFKNKTVLITGASGLVGVPTVRKCIEEGAARVIAVDIRLSEKLARLIEEHSEIDFKFVDLTYRDQCEKLFHNTNVNIVLHLAGIKGSPSRATKQPADYLFPIMMFNTNMIKAAHDANVDWFVYLSSVGVYHPAEVMREDDVWNTMPSKNDWFPGWSKRCGELAIQSLQQQYNWNNWSIIRPANIYGTNDNFSQDGTVISSNIWKLLNTTGDDIVCWGDGSARRDFVFGDDVAQATIDVVKKEVNDIINFGCGTTITIKETIENITETYYELTGTRKNIVWDTTKPNGDLIRCLDSEKQKKYNIMPMTDLKQGISLTLDSYLKDNVK